MKQLIADIKQRLLEKVTSLRYIDEDWGQLSLDAPDIPVKWPCAIIAVNQTEWTNAAKLTQHGIASVSVTVADLNLSPSNAYANPSQPAGAIYDTLQLVHRYLHGFTASAANGPLTRTLTRKVTRDDGISQYEITFVVQIHDTFAQPTYTAYPMTTQKIVLQTGITDSEQISAEITGTLPFEGDTMLADQYDQQAVTNILLARPYSQ